MWYKIEYKSGVNYHHSLCEIALRHSRNNYQRRYDTFSRSNYKPFFVLINYILISAATGIQRDCFHNSLDEQFSHECLCHHKQLLQIYKFDAVTAKQSGLLRFGSKLNNVEVAFAANSAFIVRLFIMQRLYSIEKLLIALDNCCRWVNDGWYSSQSSMIKTIDDGPNCSHGCWEAHKIHRNKHFFFG